MSKHPFEPSAAEVLHTIAMLDAQTDLVMDALCRCCGKHPIMKFTEMDFETQELRTREACIHCDVMHRWPRMDEDLGDLCLQCDRCDACATHDCGGCPTREELLEIGYTEEEIDGTD